MATCVATASPQDAQQLMKPQLDLSSLLVERSQDNEVFYLKRVVSPARAAMVGELILPTLPLVLPMICGCDATLATWSELHAVHFQQRNASGGGR